jgi:Family of unknown function (DUF5941)
VTALRAYRDDGPLAAWITGRLGTVDARRGREHLSAWLVPPLVRSFEYGFLIALTSLAEPDAMPLCFAFLGVLAFHQYDTVYRLRHQDLAPPAWVQAVGGGWDGRVLVAAALALVGGLGVGLLVATIALGLFYVSESVVSWVRFL